MSGLKLLESVEGFIPIYETDKGEKVVSGRELHQGLGVQRDFTDWIKQQLNSVDATEKDFSLLKGKTSEVGGRPTEEYILKLEIAKEICLVAGASPRANKTLKQKSKDYRKYLIQFEERYKNQVTDKQLLQLKILNGDELESAIALKEYEQMITKPLIEKIEKDTPKVDYFDALVDRSLLTNFRDTAKELHIRQKDFINWLLENNFIYRDSNNKIKPTAQALEEGLFELKEFTNEHFSSTQTLVTPKGRETFRLLLEKNKLM